MDREEVDEYVEQSQQLIEASPQMDEENTKVRLVQPFLELLGWDFYSTEVELEYTVPMASGSTHVDYALLVGDSPVVFVEAKSVRSDLTDDNVRQLKSYMRQELDVDWGILTNGKVFEVLTENRTQSNGEEVSVVQFDLEDLVENPDMLELLSKESIHSGRADEIAEQVGQTNAAIRYLQENEDSITKSIATAIREDVGELPIDLEEQSREFVQNLSSLLSEQRQFARKQPPSKPDQSAESPENTESSTSADNQGYVIRFSDERVIPDSAEETHTKQKENMGAAVDYLIENHDLISEIEVPHLPPQARKNCSINADPVHPNGEEMRGTYRLANGYFLHTHLNTAGKKSRVRDLAQQVGLTAEFVGEW